MSKIALGSVYMDRGETLEYALGAIERLSNQHPSAFYFDILCRPDQVEEAGELLTAVSKKIRELNPDIPAESMAFGLTTDDRFRPAATILAHTAHDLGGDYGFIDTNPGRPGR
jgi:hypothetical protein